MLGAWFYLYEVFIENYVSYPAFNIFSHLAAVDDRRMDEVAIAQVLEKLYWLMHDESGCRTLFSALADRENGECDAFWNMWLADKRTTSIIQHWFKTADAIEGISEDKKSWMRDASDSRLELLRPLAVTAAKLWLTKKGWGDIAYLDKSEFQVWFLKGYRSMDEQENLPEELSNWAWGREDGFALMSADEIEDLAGWAQLPKTAHWYTGLGWTLSQASQAEPARAQHILGLAIESDADAWVAMEAMATSIGNEGQYERAIAWIQKALDALLKTPNSSGIDSFLLAHVARWNQNLGDHTLSLEISKTFVTHTYATAERILANIPSPRAWNKNQASLPAAHSYVCALIQAEDWPELIYLLEYLSDMDNGYGATYLAKYFSDYNPPLQIGRACRAQGQPGFVLDALDEALQLVEQSGNDSSLVGTLMVFGELQYRFYDQDDTPVRLWEEALSRLSTAGTALSQELAHAKAICINLSAQVYFDLAVQNHRARAETSEAVTKLKSLATTTSMDPDGYDDVFFFYTTGYPSLLYGRWLRDYEKAPPAVWRKCFRARILEQMDGLSDDDPTNDTAACRALAISLFQAGDRNNAGLLLAALFGSLGNYIAQNLKIT
ncbi:hypothetical protein DHEL01_v211436 [Diaporthe helianthi]|uniref:DUF4034 domain-containing protein n=1 Tax=Diaporthe helianthi TaxID=158607 RepID=A0A2P5HIV7_DIAHE|nr:hypothetical protein DHEL01_v211436 [Diaporthe helianthi]